MHIAEFEIVDIESLYHAVAFAYQHTEYGQMWWRGQSNADWSLQPRVFTMNRGAKYERNAIARFMQRAPVRHAHTPADNARIEWLLLMQHYGAPTRLLDWTESPLTACFFSVEGQRPIESPGDVPSEDGALFALSPYLLNLSQISLDRVLIGNNSRAIEAVQPAFSPADQDVDYVVALLPFEFDIRSMAQQSAFTIHPRDLSLESIPESDGWLIKFLIPMSAKESIRDDLKRLGTHESQLFPDLQHLANEVKGLRFE